MHQWSLVRHYEGVGALTVVRVHFHLVELNLRLLFLLLNDHSSVLLEHGLRTWMVNELSLVMWWSRADQTFGVYYYAVFEEHAVRRYGVSLLGSGGHVDRRVHLNIGPLRLGAPMTLATP